MKTPNDANVWEGKKLNPGKGFCYSRRVVGPEEWQNLKCPRSDWIPHGKSSPMLGESKT